MVHFGINLHPSPSILPSISIEMEWAQYILFEKNFLAINSNFNCYLRTFRRLWGWEVSQSYKKIMLELKWREKNIFTPKR